MEGIILNFVSLIAMLLLMATFFVAQKIQYIIHAVFLFFMGIMPLIGYFNLNEITPLQYVITIVVVMSGRELIRHGVTTKQKGLKHASIALGIIIIIMSVIPVLSTFRAITFNLPGYPAVIDSLLYIIGAALLGVGTFIAKE